MACLFARMRYTACHYGQFENLLSVNKTRERRMPLASYARASGALCRNECLKLGARALGVSGASRAMACRPCVSGVGRELRRSRLWRVPLARCDTCPRAAHAVSREMRILLVRCLAGCGCPRWTAAVAYDSALAEQLVLAACSCGAPLARRRRSCT